MPDNRACPTCGNPMDERHGEDGCTSDECPKCGFLHAHDRSCEDRTPSAACAPPQRCCEWCRVPYEVWKAIRCIHTTDDLVFYSRICLERWEAANFTWQEVDSELPFPWDREVVA